MDKLKLKTDYENAVNNYLKAFCEKHDFDYEDAEYGWVAGDTGTVVCVNDYFADMQTIICDIDMDAPENEFERWCDYCIELGMLGDRRTPSYKNWLKGCPRRTEEEISNLRKIHNNVKQAKEMLLDAIKNNKYDE